MLNPGTLSFNCCFKCHCFEACSFFFFKLPFNPRDYILNKGGSQGAYPFGDLVSCSWGWVSVSALTSFLRSFLFSSVLRNDLGQRYQGFSLGKE